MNIHEPARAASLDTQGSSTSVGDQSKQATFPEKLAGREVTRNDNTQRLLPLEINALISSYIPSDEIQEMIEQAGGLLDVLPKVVKVRAQSEASVQRTLKIRNQDITTAMLQAIGRDFPFLSMLNVEGSSLNGRVHFTTADIQLLLPQRPFLTITGIVKVQFERAREKLALGEIETQDIESMYMKYRELMRSPKKTREDENSFQRYSKLLPKSLLELRRLTLDYRRLQELLCEMELRTARDVRR